jgi:hypothetical protein
MINNKKTQPNNLMYNHNNIFDMIESRIFAGNSGSTVFVPHVCNNIDLFGAGFAAQVADKYPTVKANYHMLGKNFLSKNNGYSQVVKVKEDIKHKHSLYFVNMIAQNGVRSQNNTRPLNYYWLVKSMLCLSNFIDNNTGFSNKTESIEIHCPKFGSGLAGGNWMFISDLIKDIWNKYSVSIYVPQKSSLKI